MSGRSGIYALSPKVGYTTIYAGVFIARRSTASIGAIDAVYGLRVAAEASANSRIWRVIFIVSWTTQYRPTIKRTPQSRRESGQTQCVPKRMEEQDMDRSLPSR